MGKVCSCIDKKYKSSFIDINLSGDVTFKEEPNVCKAVKPDKHIAKIIKKEDLALHVPLIKMIERIYYLRRFNKKEKYLLIQESEKMFTETIEKFTTENLKKAEEKFKELPQTDSSCPNSFFTKILLQENGTQMYSGYVDIQNMKKGFGFLLKINGNKYIGEWSNSKLNGYGRYTDKEGNIFEGIFENNSLKEGKYEKLDGTYIYKGSWINGKKHGHGKEVTNELEYIGNFKEDMKHGKGKIYLKTQEENYEGDFLDGEITGFGTYFWKNGNTYTGNFLNGKIHGNGLYKWSDGGEYEGTYERGIKQGYGKYKMKDGNIYVGPFEKGQPHGVGTLIYKGKEINNVEFLNGKLNDRRKVK